MQYKVLALDLDGTLTNTEKVITPRTKAALQEAARRGVCIVLASGRPTVGIEPLARGTRARKVRRLYFELQRRQDHRLPDRTDAGAACLPGRPDRAGLHVQPLLERRAADLRQKRHRDRGSRRPYVLEEARINKIPVRKVENLPAEVTYPINKLLLTGDPADMPHVEELMQQEFAGKLSICRSAPFFIETMPLGVGKDTSLEILLRAKGLTPANLMACGDGWNDLPMIRLAGMGVAMGNAQPPVKAAANYLTADNDHDGVGLAVEKFILNEET